MGAVIPDAAKFQHEQSAPSVKYTEEKRDNADTIETPDRYICLMRNS